MDTIGFILPTKGRPDNFRRFVNSYTENTVGYSQLLPVFDQDEVDSLYQYKGKAIITPSTKGLVEKLNYAASANPHYDYFGFVADDIVIKTPGFDYLIVQAFKANPHIKIIYCNDELNGDKIANHWVIRGSVVNEFFMALPTCRHMFIDNFWTKVGQDTNSIMYLENVVMEHRHYVGRKAPVDATYRLSNNDAVMAMDKEAFTKATTGRKYLNFIKRYNEL